MKISQNVVGGKTFPLKKWYDRLKKKKKRKNRIRRLNTSNKRAQPQASSIQLTFSKMYFCMKLPRQWLQIDFPAMILCLFVGSQSERCGKRYFQEEEEEETDTRFVADQVSVCCRKAVSTNVGYRD
jgi:hypothetical protein